MKKITPVIILTILISIIMLGCWGASTSDLPTNVSSHIEEQLNYVTPPTLTSASAGTHKELVGLKWEISDKIAKYQIYRSTSIDGEYTFLNEQAADAELIEIEVGNNSSGGSSELIAPVYYSDVDLQNGFKVWLWVPIELQITIGTEVRKIRFEKPSGGDNPHTFSRQDLINAINAQFGETVCEAYTPLNGQQYIKLTCPNSTVSSITIENSENPWIGSGTAMSRTLKSNAGDNDVVQLDPVPKGTDPGDSTVVKYFYNYNDSKGQYTNSRGDTITTNEGTHYFYKIKGIRADGAESELSKAVEGFTLSDAALAAPENITVTENNANDVNDKALKIEWQAVSSATTYQVLRSTTADGTYSKIQDIDASSATSYTDDPAPAGALYYKIVAFNGTIEGKHSNPVLGYRSKISDQEFFDEFNKTIDSSQSRIQSMGDMGNETIENGNPVYGLVSGTCEYDCGWISFMSSVEVDLTYTDFCDTYMTFNGNIYTKITNITAQSGTCTGKVTISGIYPGYVDHYLGIDGGDPASGHYEVFQKGNASPTSISLD